MNLTLQERIDWVINNPKIEKKSEMIINEIIKPLTEKAYTDALRNELGPLSGMDMKEIKEEVEQWQKENLL